MSPTSSGCAERSSGSGSAPEASATWSTRRESTETRCCSGPGPRTWWTSYTPNLLGTVLTCRAALRSMLRKPGGAIVNVGSVVGLKGNAGQGIYSATKAALEGFACSLAKEVAARNIRVNLVAPGFIRTDMTTALGEEHPKVAIPLGGFGEPSQVAHAVLFLLQTPYVTGQVLVVDDGMQLVM